MSETKAATAQRVAWQISSYSVNGSGQCVQAGPVLDGPPHYAVRDSRHPHLAQLTIARPEWATFLHAIKTERL